MGKFDIEMPKAQETASNLANMFQGYRPPESKTKRLQSLIKPSTHAKLKEMSERQNCSVNELVNQALEEFIERG